MRGRCTLVNSPRYEMYGGRGISICKEWMESFEAFSLWAHSHGYRDDDHRLSLERIDVDGNYCPENCKWIPLEDQYDNRRNTIHMGNISLSKFCREAGLNYKKVLRAYKKTNDIVFAIGLKSAPKEAEK